MKNLLTISLVTLSAVMLINFFPILFPSAGNLVSKIGVSQSISFAIDGSELLQSGSDVYSNTLRPVIRITAPFNLKNASTSIQVDDSGNILEGSFYGTVKYENRGTQIEFTPGFVLTPGTHEIIISGPFNDDASKTIFKFRLGYHESFSDPLSLSRFWITPISNPNDWFSIQNGSLQVVPRGNSDAASLAFTYPLPEGFSANFEITPGGKNVSALFYVMNSTRNQFVFGSNNDHSMVLIHSVDGSKSEIMSGEDFKLIPGQKYQIRVRKSTSMFTVLGRKLGDGQEVDSLAPDSAFTTLISSRENTVDPTQKLHVGFAVWNNSDGFVIRDFYLLGDGDMGVVAKTL